MGAGTAGEAGTETREKENMGQDLYRSEKVIKDGPRLYSPESKSWTSSPRQQTTRNFQQQKRGRRERESDPRALGSERDHLHALCILLHSLGFTSAHTFWSVCSELTPCNRARWARFHQAHYAVDFAQQAHWNLLRTAGQCWEASPSRAPV